MSFQQATVAPTTVFWSFILLLFRQLIGRQQQMHHKQFTFSLLISLNILFVAVVQCNDDILSPTIQPFPQKRAGGKLFIDICFVLF